MTERSSEWTPPPSEVTRPDQVPAEAWRAIDFLDGELVLQAWRTPPKGFLVLTNLRCFSLWRELTVFAPAPWRTGPEFFFYNLKPPRVVLGRFLELTEEFAEAGSVGRFAVHDPASAAEAISAALGPGRLEWKDRRQRTEELIRARQKIRAARVAGIPSPVIMVRCAFCGNMADASARRCPSCGAALV